MKLKTHKSEGYPATKVNRLNVRLHRVVCEAFHGPPPFAGAVTRHLDGDKSNTRPENLSWGTQGDNMADAKLHGTLPKGETSPHARITLLQATEILTRRVAGESGRCLAREFGISEGAVCDILKGRTWPDLNHLRKLQTLQTS